MSSSPGLPALDLPADEDISSLSRHLWQQGVPHRVFERSGRQVLVVYQPSDIDRVRELYRRHRQGDLPSDYPEASTGKRGSGPGPLLAALRRAPVCTVLLFLSLAGGLLVYLDQRGDWVGLLTFTEPHLGPGGLSLESLADTLASAEYWRLLTPVFLHFGVLHLVFNCLWLWEIGRRIEIAHGGMRLLGLLLLCGIGGNYGQYLSNSEVLFGGMSGVIYGLLGYTWIWGRLRPREHFHLPPGIMVVMMLWLVICASGLIEAAGLGAIANAAHVSGLLLGLFSGLVLALPFGPERRLS